MLIQEDYFKNIFNTVREAILILDENMRILSANRSFFTIFKVDSANTIGSLLYDLGNGQWNIPNLRVLLEDILPKNDTVDDFVIEHNFESIGQRTMLLNACKFSEKKNDPPIILLAIEDITERKRLEDLLAESEERYRRIFETASDGIVLLEKREGNIIHANPAAEKMLGYSEEECIGKQLQDIGVSLHMSDFPAIMQALDKSDIITYDDVQVKTKSGQDIFTDIYIVDRAGLAQCNIRDVTERKQTNETLKEEKTFIENALNTLEDVFFVFDLEGKFLRWNKAMNAVSGYSDGEIALMKPTDFFRKDDIKRVSEAIREVVKEGSASVDATVVTKDGRQIPYEYRAALLRGYTGSLIGISGVGRDLTERNKLEAQFRHSQKMEAVGQLAGGVAHDFNNILSAIIGYGHITLMKMATDDPLKVNIEQMLTAADRAAHLTKDLLLFSRKQISDRRPVDLNGIIRTVEKFLGRVIGEDIAFKTILHEGPIPVLADVHQLEQVLMNLATNAQDAMPKGGILTVAAEQIMLDREFIAIHGYGTPGMYAMITVADTGIGMDEHTRRRIFEPFFTTKEVGKGTGLGMAVVYGIIKQHEGYINVYSEPGKGTTFRIYLPVVASEIIEEKKAAQVDYSERGTETILLAEDDESLRELTVSVLKEFGYKVIVAVDGEDAVKKYIEDKDRIQLLLFDIVMPKKTGKEAYDEIKRIKPDIRVVFLSGYAPDIIRQKALLESNEPVAYKPISPADLLKKLRSVLN